MKRFVCAVLLLFAVSFIARAQVEGIPATLYQTVNARGGPGTQYRIVGQVSEGDTVTVIARAASESLWLQVILPSGETGWIPSYLLIFEADPGELPFSGQLGDGGPRTDSGVTITAYGRINVRSGPSIISEVIDQLEPGEQARALARGNERNDWLYVENESTAGWVAYFTVYVEGDPDSLPLRVPEASTAALVHPEQLIRTRFNTRLHSEPALSSPTVMVVPFNTEVTPLARSEDGEWLYVRTDDTAGWAAADLFVVGPENVDMLPLFDALALQGETTPEPEATAPAAG